MSKYFLNTLQVGKLFLFLIVCVSFTGFVRSRDSMVYVSNCRKIEVNADVRYESTNKKKGTIVIDYKGQDEAQFRVSVIGPEKYYLKDLQDKEIKGLSKGRYSVVIVGKDESSNYCPTHIQVVI